MDPFLRFSATDLPSLCVVFQSILINVEDRNSYEIEIMR